MLCRETNAVCSEIHTKHIDTLSGQNSQIVIVKEICTYDNKRAIWD